ncbi:MAG TPA: MFS transporter [Nitrososphaerales archaeon]|nr:MFS transporter [Nitrososphaerales archaeon]
MQSPALNTKAFSSLIFARIVYAINWLNLGAIFYLVSPDIGAGVSGLGTVTSTFFLGVGLMQIPGGLLAAKLGSKRVVVVGIFLSSLSALGTSILSTIPQMAVLRFLVGVGMALVFAPGVVIIARLIGGGSGKSGIGVGLFNSAFDLGGLAAFIGWIVIATATGWRISLALGGGLGVITGVLVAFFVPGDNANSEFNLTRPGTLSILMDKQLVILGLATLGLGIGNAVITGFMVYYLINSLSISGTVAGLIGTLVTFVPIFSAVWGGRFYDRIMRHRMVMILCLLGSAASLAIGAFPSLYAAAACSALGGLFSGIGYTFAFAGARDIHKAEKEYDSLAIAWINSIQLTGSFLPPIFFSYLVEAQGYSQAWLGSGGLTLIFVIPVLLMAERWTR